jgi:GNAT superfamily N-acetyltransferase
VIKVRLNRTVSKHVKKLYKSAFPKPERVSWFTLKHGAKRNVTSLWAYMDGDKFCGFTHAYSTDKMALLLYFAINENERSKGYGSQILQLLKEEYKGKTIVINVEPLDESAENYAQRKRRLNFYNKNGFFDTGYLVEDVGGLYIALSNTDNFNPQDYKDLYLALTKNRWNPEVVKK